MYRRERILELVKIDMFAVKFSIFLVEIKRTLYWALLLIWTRCNKTSTTVFAMKNEDFQLSYCERNRLEK